MTNELKRFRRDFQPFFVLVFCLVHLLMCMNRVTNQITMNRLVVAWTNGVIVQICLTVSALDSVYNHILLSLHCFPTDNETASIICCTCAVYFYVSAFHLCVLTTGMSCGYSRTWLSSTPMDMTLNLWKALSSVESSVLPTRTGVFIRLFMYTGNTFIASGRISCTWCHYKEKKWYKKSKISL